MLVNPGKVRLINANSNFGFKNSIISSVTMKIMAPQGKLVVEMHMRIVYL